RVPQCRGLIDQSVENGVGFISFSQLQQGLLTGRYLNGVPADSRMAKGIFLKEEMLTPTLLNALNGLNDLAARRGQSLAQMALSWLLNDARVTSVIIGASSVSQLEDNLQCLGAPAFTSDELSLIEQLSEPIQLR
ncbi:MAG: aldo/keto reductase, partial [Bacteroidales bacterium]|nr:aldo/keto reductase [Bacteroidales bacterium]